MAGTLDLGADDLHLLPANMRELVAVIGLPALLRLVEVYGGTVIHVPARMKTAGGAPARARTADELRGWLGDDAFLKLVDHHAGERIEIARCVKAVRHLIHRQIRNDAAAGLSQRELALKYKYTIRGIHKIEVRGEPVEDKNLSLWGD